MFAIRPDVFKKPPEGEDVAVWAIRGGTGSAVFRIRKVDIIKCFHDFLNHSCDGYERARDIFQLHSIGF